MGLSSQESHGWKAAGSGRRAPPVHTGHNVCSPRLRVYHPVEDRAVSRVDGGGDSVDRGGAGKIEPFAAQADTDWIGLSLQTPADVVGGPAQGQLITIDGEGDIRAVGIDGGGDAQGAVSGERVGVPAEAWAGGEWQDR